LTKLQGTGADHLHPIGSIRLLALSSAGVADAEDLQIVKGRSESLAIADLALTDLDQRVVELDHASARGADEMVVMRVSADVLVMVVVLAEMDAANHP